MLRPVLVSPSTSLLLVTLADAKTHLKVDFTDDDALITALIVAAESFLDSYSGIVGRALLTQTWSQAYDSFYARMKLRIGIVSSVTSVSYYDVNNVQQTLATSVYQLLTDDLGSYVSLKPLQLWPLTFTRDDAITITWVAGYGGTASTVPTAIIIAMKMFVAHWYEFRGIILADRRLEQVPLAAMALLEPFKRTSL